MDRRAKKIIYEKEVWINVGKGMVKTGWMLYSSQVEKVRKTGKKESIRRYKDRERKEARRKRCMEEKRKEAGQKDIRR